MPSRTELAGTRSLAPGSNGAKEYEMPDMTTHLILTKYFNCDVEFIGL